MKADSPLADAVVPSPNHGERRGSAAVDMLILHYTGMESGSAALARLCDPGSEVSAHYLVEEDGRIIQLVPENRRAWHAGRSLWRGSADINSRSLGIEIVNPGHTHGYRPFPEPQVAATIALCGDCIRRWGIAPDDVLAHSDIAPARKQDPGELFPWDRLYRHGIGHFRPAAPVASGPSVGDAGEVSALDAFQRDLQAYGYDIDVTARPDEKTVAATIAFQRHFRPERVDGIADPSTVATLRDLLRTRRHR